MTIDANTLIIILTILVVGLGIGVLLLVLRKKGSGSEDLGALIKDFDRNPLMHPRISLDTNDALSMFSLVHSAIISMLAELLAKHEDLENLKIVPEAVDVQAESA